MIERKISLGDPVGKKETNGEVKLLPEKEIDLDDVLVNELGQFGRFQLVNILLVALPMMLSTFPYDYIFSAADVPHRCRIPECEETNSTIYSPEWIYNAIPKTDSSFSNCKRYAPVSISDVTQDRCPARHFNQSIPVDCEEFVYAKNNTVVYDFDLGCQNWLRAFAGTMNSIGTLLVLPITGFISDRFGRRMALIINVFNLGIFGVARAFSVNYPMYLTLQLLQTALGTGTFSTAYIFATELVGPKYRLKIGATCSTVFSLGEVTLGVLAYLIQPWRYLTLTLFIPCFLIVAYHWILSESIRWLLSKQKYEEARILLAKVAKANKKVVSEKSLQGLLKPSPTVNKINPEGPGLIRTILKSPILLRRVCTTPVWWITATFIYYGLSINSTTLSDTMHLNYILTSAAEFPGYVTAALVVDRYGRRPTLASGYFWSAMCNIAFAFIPGEMATLRLVLYLLGKYGIAIVFTSLYLYTSELYPTEYRHTLLAFSSMIGRIGSIVAPLTPVLKVYWDGIPSVLFGCLSLIAGTLILTQPETLGTRLPDTLAEAEALGQSAASLQKN